MWKFSPSDSRKWPQNQKNIFVIKKCGCINRFHGQSPTVIIGTPDSDDDSYELPAFPLASPIPVGRLHPAFCQSWNLDRTLPVRAKQNSQKPPTSSQPSFGYDRSIMSAGRIVGWWLEVLCSDISSWWCSDTELAVTAFSAGSEEEELVTSAADNGSSYSNAI